MEKRRSESEEKQKIVQSGSNESSQQREKRHMRFLISQSGADSSHHQETSQPNLREVRENQKKARYEELSRIFWDTVLGKYGSLPPKKLPHETAAFLGKIERNDFEKWTDNIEAAHCKAVRESEESLVRVQDGKAILERNLKAFEASLKSFDKTYERLQRVLTIARRQKERLDSNTDEVQRVIDSFAFFTDKIADNPAAPPDHKKQYEDAHYDYVHTTRRSNLDVNKANDITDLLEKTERDIIEHIAYSNQNLTSLRLIQVKDQYKQSIATDASEEAKKQAMRDLMKGYRSVYTDLSRTN